MKLFTFYLSFTLTEGGKVSALTDQLLLHWAMGGSIWTVFTGKLHLIVNTFCKYAPSITSYICVIVQESYEFKSRAFFLDIHVNYEKSVLIQAVLCLIM